MKNLRLKFLGGTFPASIQIISSHVTSKITIDNSINIYHRKNMKIVLLNDPLIKLITCLGDPFDNLIKNI